MPENIYKQDKAEHMQKSSGDILHDMFADNGNDVSSYLKLSEQNRLVAVSVLDGIAPIGKIGGYCEEGFPLLYASRAMYSMMGYGSFDEFYAAFRERSQIRYIIRIITVFWTSLPM